VNRYGELVNVGSVVTHDNVDESVFFLPLATVDAWPESLPFAAPLNVSLAVEERNIPVAHLGPFADRIILQHPVIIQCWGPDYDRIHDILDESIVALNVLKGVDSLDIDTIGASGQLRDDLWFLVYSYTCNAKHLLIAAIGSEVWCNFVAGEACFVAEHPNPDPKYGYGEI
jgi:hypothetical protein